MPKYRVHASEVVYYSIKVEADSRDDAYEVALNISPSMDDIIGGDYFQIEEIVEVEDAKT